MSELSSSNCQFSSLLISDLIRLSSFILSHPLYFSYFLFFSPYLLKLISFLSPLFITTSLVVLTFLARTESCQTRFASILKRLQFKKDCPDEEFHLSDDLGMYETVFGSEPMAAAVTENDPSEFSVDDNVVKTEEDFGGNKACAKPGNPFVVMEEKRLENFFKILDEFERLASNVEEMKKKMEPPSSLCAKPDKVVEKQKSLLMNGFEAASDDDNMNNVKAAAAKLNLVEERSSPMAKSQSQRIMSCISDHHDQGRHLDGNIDGKLKVRAESCRAMDCRD